MRSKDETWALFWCGLLHEVLFGPLAEREVCRYLRKLSRTEVVFPDGRRKKPSLSTLKRKLAAYRDGGFEALARKPRKDRGQPRSVPAGVIETAIEAKKEQPRRSDEAINRILEDRHGVTIPRSTLYRYLKEAGATRIKLGFTKKPVRKRWTREHTHDLWVGDFEEGPHALVGEETVPTYLCAFIDCHSRYIVDGRYYVGQTLDILMDSWVRAVVLHGAPLALYVDNAKVYHSKALRSACYRLHIALLHRPPHDAAAGGLIERFFGTVQSQFEAEVRAGAILTLERLNRAFSAWLAVSYHQRVHSETGQAPKTRYEAGLQVRREVDLEEVMASFRERAERKVNPDFADVQLHGCFYRVDKRLRGDKVEVRYDPFSVMETVWIYSLQGEYLGKGRRHAREKGERPPPTATPWTPPHYDYPELLIRKHDEQLRTATRGRQVEQAGIDYRRVVQQRAWPFYAFVKTFARLQGRTAGLTAFSAGELETLKKLYDRSTDLNEILLKDAFRRATVKTIPHVARELQQLIREKRKERD